ncbi:3-oxoacid CoA-transferase subunit A [Orrella sp. NBD-18]|uniref:3-oxoacid CoA-transferase subunit A n=1 Tax=Sheuella amnicola TaxID=2707330 RepID=A0A6B2R0L3_9BURK|nr:3-oxoacid CoA-transferase subunit A [Sheuella amnicola]NDY83802.1 3-oxoacid CoA-transferase subunit A [Sheuella amnicola]HBI82985.1 3-oxoadipate CoA-transferase [Alcaligenaceae bacterium]
MLNKISASLEDAVAPIQDGAVLLVSGFGEAGIPFELMSAIMDKGLRELTIVSNNAGTQETGIAGLIKAGRVRKIVCSHPRPPKSDVFANAYRAGQLELECMPQGTLAERLRAAGAGLGPFFTPTGYGTLVAEGKEQRVIDGKGYILEQPLHGDFALVRAHLGDRWGNLTYRWAARNFGPVMCMASKHSIAQVNRIVPLGELAPEHVMTPGIFVKSVVAIGGER